MTAMDRTSRIVRGAHRGDPEDLGRLVERFTPWLLVQARFRLRRALARLCEPEDLVNEVWLVALPKLDTLRPRSGRLTPVLVRFLATTLLNRLQTLMEKHLRTRRRAEPPATDLRDRVERLPDSVTDALAGAQVRERQRILWNAVQELPPRDQQLVVLRGLEQHSMKDVAVLLGITPNHATVAYRRCCQRLRGLLDPILLRDLCEE